MRSPILVKYCGESATSRNLHVFFLLTRDCRVQPGHPEAWQSQAPLCCPLRRAGVPPPHPHPPRLPRSMALLARIVKAKELWRGTSLPPR